MNTFHDRAHALENQFAHQQNILFTVSCRRARLAGKWAAEHLGILGDRAEEYAQEVVASSVETLGEYGMARKLLADFERNGVAMSDHRLTRHLDRLWKVAHQEVMTTASA